MYIKATDDKGFIRYINVDKIVSFAIEDKAVFAWFPDNLTLELQKTKELKDQLDRLLIQKTDKGFEKFE